MSEKSTKYNLVYLLKIITFTTVIVSILGYIDNVTGEISIDILYLLCICLVTWYTNILIGILCVVEIILAKISADYFGQIRVGTHLYEWNILNDIVTYIIVCILVGKLKKALTS